MSGLHLQDGTIGPFIVAVAPRQPLFGITVDIEDPRRHSDWGVSRHADVGEGLIVLDHFEIGFELAPAQPGEVSLIVGEHRLPIGLAILREKERRLVNSVDIPLRRNFVDDTPNASEVLNKSIKSKRPSLTRPPPIIPGQYAIPGTRTPPSQVVPLPDLKGVKPESG